MNRYHAAQLLLPLTQTVVTEFAHSLVCLPDRTTASCELEKLRRDHGGQLIRAAIRKDRPGKSSTYTLRYITRESKAVRLF